MSGWEVSSSGLAHFASWRCETCDCGSGNRFVTRLTGKPGDAEEIRQAAVDHLKRLGHQVSFSRGMAEVLSPLATERPQP